MNWVVMSSLVLTPNRMSSCVNRRPQVPDLSGLKIQYDAWLSEVSKFDCYGVELPQAATETTNQQTGPSCFYTAKLAVSDTIALTQFLSRGFRLVDTAITFRSDPPDNSPTSTAGGYALSIELAKDSDLSSVESIASSAFSFSRFHFDPEFPNIVADEIKRQWARNLVLGKRGDGCLVARSSGRIVGFLGFNSNALGDHVIDLVAVEQSSRASGVGSALVAFVQNLARRNRCAVVVGTQIANRASVRLYERLGFRFDSASYVLHGHSLDSEAV